MPNALPFWVSLALVPFAWIAAIYGSFAIALVPLATWALFSILDRLSGLDLNNADINADDSALVWHRLATVVWAPVQFLTVFGTIGYMVRSDYLSTFEMFGVVFGVGVLSGTIGIVYALYRHGMPKKPCLPARVFRCGTDPIPSGGMSGSI